ncbi:MAG: hypothetical protein AB1898_26420 [Acidobacteriota bacterium]
MRVEKSLASLGFFTPSSKTIKGVRAKTIHFTRQMNGQRIEVRAVILPSAVYGLPVTSDQDKYLAFQKIVTSIRRARGKVTNPVGFLSSELLRILNLNTKAGKHYDDIVEWGKRMTLTGISSEGVVYLAGRKTWASDTFHVFERFVSVGTELPDGTIAERNYVWLSDWQLENINHDHVLPVNLNTYRKLRNHIAKALVPLIQVWLYATLQVGIFEKRYRDLCQILHIAEYKHMSKVREKLGPSLDELQKYGYISGWRIQETVDGGDYKIILCHGQNFRSNAISQSRHSQLGTQTNRPEEARQTSDRQISMDLLHELMKRGIREKAAIALLRGLQPGQHAMDQLEWGDHLLANSPNRKQIRNPAGLYIHLLKENAIPPSGFGSSRIKKLREEARHEQARETEHDAIAQLDYMRYRDVTLDQYIQSHYTPDEVTVLVEAKRREMLQQTYWKRIAHNAPLLTEAARRQVRSSIARDVPFLTFSQFLEERTLTNRPLHALPDFSTTVQSLGTSSSGSSG